MSDPLGTGRAAFHDASECFLATLDGVTDWDAPGLGEWTVRELTAHAMRAYLVIEQYLAADPPADGAELRDASGYYRAVLSNPEVHRGVADRGREAGALLTDPPAEARALAARVLPIVDATADDRPLKTPGGAMRFGDYLVTRVVELTVHTLDLQIAIGAPAQAPPVAVQACLDALRPLATPVELLLGITGRRVLNVVA